MAILDRANQAVATAKSIISIIGWLGLSGWLTGIVAAIGGSVWAMINGLAAPIVIMIAFCTLTGAIYMAMAPLAFRVLLGAQKSPIRIRPNPEIWRHSPQLKLFEAACLLADLEPDVTAITAPGDAYGWYRLLSVAVAERQIPRIPTAFDDHHTFSGAYHPHEETPIARSELKKFAEEKKTVRAFLMD